MPTDKKPKDRRRKPRKKKTGETPAEKTTVRRKKKKKKSTTTTDGAPNKERRKKPRKRTVIVTKKSPQKKAKKNGRRGRKRPDRRRQPRADPHRVRVIPMGGVEEVGRNLIIIEIGHDIFVSDVGFEFGAEAPGINYILPNTGYLEDRSDRIKGIFITHGHLDHIGGVPYIMDRIGNPPIYTRPLTAKILEKRQLDFPGKPKLRIHIVEPDEPLTLGDTRITPFTVTHSIPQSMGLKFETDQGNIIISGDFKLDHKNGKPTAEEKARYKKLGNEKNLFLIADSTNAERPGFSIPEREVQENISKEIRKCKGRLIIGTFASQLARIISIIHDAQKTKRRVVLEGRSMVNNVEIAREIGLVTVKDDVFISAKDAHKYPDKNLLILVTGAQGEENAALNRIARDRHPHIKLSEKDTVMLSSSVIPGNERAVQSLRDCLLVDNLKIIHYRTSDIHSTGHGNAGELVWINKQINARYFMPGYGFRTMTRAHANAVADAGFPKKNILIGENGTVIDFVKGKMQVAKKKVDATMMVVDGKLVGEADALAIRERQILAESGLFIMILTISAKNGRVLLPPKIVLKGIAGSDDLQIDAGNMAKRMAERSLKGRAGSRGLEKTRELIQEALRKYLEEKTAKNPLVVAVINPV